MCSSSFRGHKPNNELVPGITTCDLVVNEVKGGMNHPLLTDTIPRRGSQSNDFWIGQDTRGANLAQGQTLEPEVTLCQFHLSETRSRSDTEK